MAAGTQLLTSSDKQDGQCHRQHDSCVLVQKNFDRKPHGHFAVGSRLAQLQPHPISEKSYLCRCVRRAACAHAALFADGFTGEKGEELQGDKTYLALL